MRARFLPLLIFAVALAAVPACFFEVGHEDEPEGSSLKDVSVYVQQSHLMDRLTAIAGGECQVEIAELVTVRVSPGARGVPDTAMLRRMSEEIIAETGKPARDHLILTDQGRVLFANGAPVP